MSAAVCGRRSPALARATFALLAPLLSVAAAADPAALEQGRRIYREGVLPSGEPLRAVSAGGGALAGAQAACTSCHRRSGFGSAEGGRLVPPIAADFLFRPRQPREPGATASAGAAAMPAGSRPAYDLTALRRALREGTDPAGRRLDALMPRYELDDAGLESLAAYLRTLSAQDSEGVSATDMHFATIVTEGVTTGQRQALLGVLETFFRDHNTEVRGETRRGARAEFGHSRAYRAWRKWQLHVWQLNGPSATWGEQLERHYRAQPVFAVVSGAGPGAWRPVHEFCERRELPCLFPNTDQPEVRESDFYSIYLTRGLELEATVLAQHLRQQSGAQRITQVYREGEPGAAAAERLRRALSVAPAMQVSDRRLVAGEHLDAARWRKVARDSSGEAIVLWLGHDELDALAPAPPAGELYLSSSLAGYPAHAIPAALRERARLVHPFELPSAWQTKRERLVRWLRVHGLEPGDERIQANAYLAANLLGGALKHFRERYSRDYLIERIEHMADNSPWTSVFPHLGLGTGQRFASKGGYVIRLAPDGTVAAASEWIVPAL
jgi:cytochrome c553